MPRLLLLLLGTGCAAPPAAVASAPSEPTVTATGPIRAAYEALRDAGCGADLRVWTPVEARIFRNAPYAIAGLRFTDADLAAAFARDGGWYAPSLATPPALAAVDAACVARLAAREAELRAAWSLPPELEGRLIRDPALFRVLRGWGGGTVNPYGAVRAAREEDGTWQLWIVAAGCDPGPGVDCAGYAITCPVEGPCQTVAAG